MPRWAPRLPLATTAACWSRTSWKSSDAYRRGLRYDDEIVSFGGRPIGTVNAFKNALGIYPKGWRVPLVYRRDGKEHEIQVRLTGVHAAEELLQADAAASAPGAATTTDPRPDDRPKPGDRPEPGNARQARRAEADSRAGAAAGGRASKTLKIPPEIQKMIQPRGAFANYYFNELNRDRVWNSSCKAKGDFRSVAGAWKLTGQLAEAARSR